MKVVRNDILNNLYLHDKLPILYCSPSGSLQISFLTPIDEHQPPPAPRRAQHGRCNGRHRKGADAAAADRDAGRQGAPPLEVEARRDHGRHVDEAEPDTYRSVRNEYRGFNVSTRVVQRCDVFILYSVILTSSTDIYIYKSKAVLI